MNIPRYSAYNAKRDVWMNVRTIWWWGPERNYEIDFVGGYVDGKFENWHALAASDDPRAISKIEEVRDEV